VIGKCTQIKGSIHRKGLQMLSSENLASNNQGHGLELTEHLRVPSGTTNAERILIVDENPKNSMFLEGLLREHYQVIVANRGTKGLQMALAEDQPDLILLEADMPRLDGFTVCEMLQSNIYTRHIPIMFLATAQKKGETAARGMSLGAVDFVFRPISSAKLLGKISSYLSTYGWMGQERRCARNSQFFKQQADGARSSTNRTARTAQNLRPQR
jgi:response regulator RpfG family c-di-GMP phosphodiesterase